MPGNPSASNKSPDSASIDLILHNSNAQQSTEDVETEALTYAYRCGPGVVILTVYDKQSGRIVTEMWIMRRPGRAGTKDGKMPREGAVRTMGCEIGKEDEEVGGVVSELVEVEVVKNDIMEMEKE
jgi:hypothetical protein